MNSHVPKDKFRSDRNPSAWSKITPFEMIAIIENIPSNGLAYNPGFEKVKSILKEYNADYAYVRYGIDDADKKLIEIVNEIRYLFKDLTYFQTYISLYLQKNRGGNSPQSNERDLEQIKQEKNLIDVFFFNVNTYLYENKLYPVDVYKNPIKHAYNTDFIKKDSKQTLEYIKKGYRFRCKDIYEKYNTLATYEKDFAQRISDIDDTINQALINNDIQVLRKELGDLKITGRAKRLLDLFLENDLVITRQEAIEKFINDDSFQPAKRDLIKKIEKMAVFDTKKVVNVTHYMLKRIS